MTHQLILNHRRNVEHMQKFGGTYPTGLANMIEEIITRFVELHGEELFPDESNIMTAPVFEASDGTIIEAKSRKLSTRYYLSDINQTSVDDAVASLYEEISAEIKGNPGVKFYPYQLITSSGVVIDPVTFEPIVAFLTRYGAR